MTATDSEWLQMKRMEHAKCCAWYGDRVDSWDSTKYLEIIDAQAKEISRLKRALETAR